ALGPVPPCLRGDRHRRVHAHRVLVEDAADLADGGSDRFLDAMVVWGDEAAIRARVDEHLAAGADHVCLQVLSTDDPFAAPLDAWRRLAPALTA
ncbi:MAG: hypothetical protein ACKOOG_13825, partial [Actinomycetota bacterium]